jgi:hypothetical protein
LKRIALSHPPILSLFLCFFFVLFSLRAGQANAFYQSYLISVALSIFVLQAAKAFVGGLFTTLTSGAVSVALLAGLATGQLFAMQ